MEGDPIVISLFKQKRINKTIIEDSFQNNEQKQQRQRHQNKPAIAIFAEQSFCRVAANISAI